MSEENEICICGFDGQNMLCMAHNYHHDIVDDASYEEEEEKEEPVCICYENKQELLCQAHKEEEEEKEEEEGEEEEMINGAGGLSMEGGWEAVRAAVESLCLTEKLRKGRKRNLGFSLNF